MNNNLDNDYNNSPISLEYVGFGRRFVAYLIDYLIIFPISLVVQLLLGQNPFAVFQVNTLSELQQLQQTNYGNTTTVATLISLLIAIAFYLIMWVNFEGATPGKKVMAIKIVKVDGSKITYPVAFIRYIGYLISSFIFLLGFFWILWDKKKQGWHDKLAGTLVIRTEKTPNTPLAIFLALIGFFIITGYAGATMVHGFKLGMREAISEKVANTEIPEDKTTEYIKLGSIKMQTANQLAAKENLTTEERDQIAGLVSGALKDFKNATEQDPTSSYAWYNRAIAYKMLIGTADNSEDFAIEAIEKAISLDPNNPSFYLESGSIYLLIENYEKAIDNFQKVTKMKPDYANGFYNLGIVYKKVGSYGEAKKALQKALEILPEDHKDRYKVEMELSDL